jgi:hypothetical protein
MGYLSDNSHINLSNRAINKVPEHIQRKEKEKRKRKEGEGEGEKGEEDEGEEEGEEKRKGKERRNRKRTRKKRKRSEKAQGSNKNHHLLLSFVVLCSEWRLNQFRGQCYCGNEDISSDGLR